MCGAACTGQGERGSGQGKARGPGLTWSTEPSPLLEARGPPWCCPCPLLTWVTSSIISAGLAPRVPGCPGSAPCGTVQLLWAPFLQKRLQCKGWEVAGAREGHSSWGCGCRLWVGWPWPKVLGGLQQRAWGGRGVAQEQKYWVFPWANGVAPSAVRSWTARGPGWTRPSPLAVSKHEEEDAEDDAGHANVDTHHDASQRALPLHAAGARGRRVRVCGESRALGVSRAQCCNQTASAPAQGPRPVQTPGVLALGSLCPVGPSHRTEQGWEPRSPAPPRLPRDPRSLDSLLRVRPPALGSPGFCMPSCRETRRRLLFPSPFPLKAWSLISYVAEGSVGWRGVRDWGGSGWLGTPEGALTQVAVDVGVGCAAQHLWPLEPGSWQPPVEELKALNGTGCGWQLPEGLNCAGVEHLGEEPGRCGD